jgi:hypothetical protein
MIRALKRSMMQPGSSIEFPLPKLRQRTEVQGVRWPYTNECLSTPVRPGVSKFRICQVQAQTVASVGKYLWRVPEPILQCCSQELDLVHLHPRTDTYAKT